MATSAKKLIHPRYELPRPARVKSDVARALIAALERSCRSYCVLSGYEGLPDSFDTDIDFMVDEKDFKNMPRILDAVARETGTRMMLAVEHETSARAFFLASVTGAALTIVQPDCASDYRHFGALWLRGPEVLAARRWHPGGFWIPSAVDEFAYYLVKRINKGDVSPRQGNTLHRLYAEDTGGCARALARFWSGSQWHALRHMAKANDWSRMPELLVQLRDTMRRNTAESLPQRMLSRVREAFHFAGRILRPTGAWIALIGPDGSGKSLVLRALQGEFAAAFRAVPCFHLRPHLLRGLAQSDGPVTDPHGKRPRGLVASIAKVFYLAADYTLGYALKVVPRLVRTQLVLFDRYIDDIVVDSKRVRYGGPAWLLRLAARLVPRPDLVILLDAPAEVLWARKREVPFDEVVRQRAAYREHVQKLSHAVVVDASQPVEGLMHDVLDVVVEHLARRTAARLKLRRSPMAAPRLEASGRSRPC
jgi:thymidylate kinase